MNKINKDWHEANKMPRNATLEQKIKWHTNHAENCNCRPMSHKLLDIIGKKETKL